MIPIRFKMKYLVFFSFFVCMVSSSFWYNPNTLQKKYFYTNYISAKYGFQGDFHIFGNGSYYLGHSYDYFKEENVNTGTAKLFDVDNTIPLFAYLDSYYIRNLPKYTHFDTVNFFQRYLNAPAFVFVNNRFIDLYGEDAQRMVVPGYYTNYDYSYFEYHQNNFDINIPILEANILDVKELVNIALLEPVVVELISDTNPYIYTTYVASVLEWVFLAPFNIISIVLCIYGLYRIFDNILTLIGFFTFPTNRTLMIISTISLWITTFIVAVSWNIIMIKVLDNYMNKTESENSIIKEYYKEIFVVTILLVCAYVGYNIYNISNFYFFPFYFPMQKKEGSFFDQYTFSLIDLFLLIIIVIYFLYVGIRFMLTLSEYGSRISLSQNPIFRRILIRLSTWVVISSIFMIIIIVTTPFIRIIDYHFSEPNRQAALCFLNFLGYVGTSFCHVMAFFVQIPEKKSEQSQIQTVVSDDMVVEITDVEQ